MKVLNIGSLNIDLVNRVDHIVRPGETAPVLSFARFAGGKGLNQSVALARAGAEVLHAGAVGADGLFLKELLESEGVECSGIAVLKEVPTGYALIQVAKDGENAILVNGGANHAVTQELAEKVLSRMEPGDILLLQNEISSLPEIFRSAAAKKLRIFFNPSPLTPGIAELPLELADTLLVNEEEAAALRAAVPEKFAACNTVTTMGAKGAEFRSVDGETVFVPAFPAPKVVDTTGAGDTFTGFYVSAIARGADVRQALTEGAAAAAIAVSRPGAAAAIPRRSELEI